MTSPSSNPTIQEQLAEPFGAEDVKSYTAGRAGALSYIDARSVMNRLDCVVGMEGWEDIYTVIDFATKAVECRLTIHVEGGSVTKTDVGYPNDAEDADNASKEPLKAAYSDALKRAAVKFGIGRHLYNKTPQRPPAAPQRPTAASTPQASAFPEGELRQLLADAGLTAADLVPVTGKGDTGGPLVRKWLDANAGKTVGDLVKVAIDAKAVPA